MKLRAQVRVLRADVRRRAPSRRDARASLGELVLPEFERAGIDVGWAWQWFDGGAG
jgi:hypothetical protein